MANRSTVCISSALRANSTYSTLINALNLLQNNRLDVLLELANNHDLGSLADSEFNTLMHHACLIKNTKGVRLLLDMGISADIPNADGQTPLCDAALNGSDEIIAILLKHGVTIDPQSTWGTPLYHATRNGNLSAMRMLIDAGAKLNIPGRDGRCPLHITATMNFVEGTEMLLEAGADPNFIALGTTALHLAVQRDHFAVAECLLNYGACPRLIDIRNRTPISISTANSRCFKLLQSAEHKFPSLQSLVRRKMRDCFGLPGCRKLAQLKLPRHLQDYVSFNTV